MLKRLSDSINALEQKSCTKRILCILWVLILLIALTPILYISLFNRPSADDYTNSIGTHQVVMADGGFSELIKTAFETARTTYNTWQGTYTTDFLFPLQPGVINEKNYAATAYIMLLSIFLSLWAMFSVIARRLLHHTKIGYPLYLALLGTTVIALGMPSPTEGLFWYTGAMHYVPWLMATVLTLSITYELYYVKKLPGKLLLVVVAMVLCLAISGANQITAFLNILLLLLATVLLIGRKRFYSLWLLLAALAGFIFMFLAPGNSVRAGYFVQPGLIKTLVASATYALMSLMQWGNLSLLCVVLLFTPLFVKIVKSTAGQYTYRYPGVFTLVSLVLICAMLCVPYYAVGGMGGARIGNIIWMTTLLLLMANITYWLGWGSVKHRPLAKWIITRTETIGCVRGFLLAVLCFTCVFFSSSGDFGQKSTSMQAVRDILNGSAKSYAGQMDQRYQLMYNSDSAEIVLPPLSVSSQLLFVADLTNDPIHWINKGYAEYYGLERVVSFSADASSSTDTGTGTGD